MICKIDDTIKVPGPFSSQNLNQMTLFIFLYDSRKKWYSDISGNIWNQVSGKYVSKHCKIIL